MKKKLTAVLLVVSLIALMVAGATVAYFKDTDSAVNVFTMGNVEIVMLEDNGLDSKDPDYKLDDEYEDWVAIQDFLPTVTLEKDAWIKNIGTENAYVRMFVLYPKDVANLIDIAYDAEIGTKWAEATAEDDQGNAITMADVEYDIDGVAYIGKCYVWAGDDTTGILAPGASTTDTITSVTLKNEVECEVLADGSTLYTLTENGVDYSYTSAEGLFPVIVCAQAGQVTNGLAVGEEGYWDNANAALNIMFNGLANPYGGSIAVDVAQNRGVITVEGTTVTAIGDYENVVIPAGMTAIGDNAGAFNTTIKNVVLSDGVTEIGYQSFRQSSIETVELPDTLTSIGNRAFHKCLALEEVVIPDSVTFIDEYAFAQTGAKRIVLPNNLTRIETAAFAYNNELTEITIPASVTEIGNYAFRACAKLTTIKILGDNVDFDANAVLVFGTTENGHLDGVTIYVKNETVKENVMAHIATAWNDYTIVVNPDLQ